MTFGLALGPSVIALKDLVCSALIKRPPEGHGVKALRADGQPLEEVVRFTGVTRKRKSLGFTDRQWLQTPLTFFFFLFLARTLFCEWPVCDWRGCDFLDILGMSLHFIIAGVPD